MDVVKVGFAVGMWMSVVYWYWVAFIFNPVSIEVVNVVTAAAGMK